jgi:C4-dicarboxylate-specific signal transduction histidine kinase
MIFVARGKRPIEGSRQNKYRAALADAQAQLARANRIATLGELAASIAHDVNQPLAAILANGEANVRWLDRPVPEIDTVRQGL